MVLKSISFSVNKGEHVSIVGESGSGKSTLLKLIYGEFDLNKGEITWKDKPVLGPSHNLVVGYEYMKYVAQEFDLMSYTTVAENIGKFLSNLNLKKKREKIEELLHVVELSEFANIKVQFLSGGQKQRVALARALAKQPEIILLDEPFSHIDNFKKRSLRKSLFKFLKEEKITCLVATHDRDDVLGYADTILVLHKGELVAKDSPEQLYKRPKSPLIASFFSEFNIIEPYGIVYAHQLKVVDKSNLKVVISNVFFKGNYYLIEAKKDNGIIFFNHDKPINKGQLVYLEINLLK